MMEINIIFFHETASHVIQNLMEATGQNGN
jgi:hypothetical protein